MTDLNVIIPNLHWNYTGVTATNRMIAPRVARLIAACWLGADAPAGIATMSFRDLLALRFRGRRPIVWHARRNNEMMAGLALKALGWPLRLVFTSAAQRHHTWITRWLIARMDAVVATSPASASYLHVPHDVITHGVDTERYRPSDNRETELREAGITTRYAIGCFGRVRHQKGTDLFVEAMCRLLPRYPDFSAVIVGAIDDASFERALKDRIAQSGLQGRIRILGELPIDDVPAWYRRVLIYAFTSRNEGFGLTIIEAMASGDALVATRAGAAEVVVRDQDNGLLVPTDNADALTQALETLMRDPAAAAAMGARARKYIVEKFSVEAEAEKYAAIYRRVLA